MVVLCLDTPLERMTEGLVLAFARIIGNKRSDAGVQYQLEFPTQAVDAILYDPGAKQHLELYPELALLASILALKR